MTQAAIQVLQCPACLAPVTPLAGGSVQTCEFCNATLRTEAAGEVHDVVPFTSSDVDILRAVGRVYPAKPGRSVAVTHLLFPAFFVSARAESKWSAEMPTQYKDGSTRFSAKSGSLKHTYTNLFLLAAPGPWAKALADMGTRALAAVPVRPEHLRGATILDVESTERQRVAVARQAIETLQGEQVRRAVGRGSRRVSHSTDVEQMKLERVLVPLWAFQVEGPGDFRVIGYVSDTNRGLTVTRRTGESTGGLSGIRTALLGGTLLLPAVAGTGLFTLVCCCGGLPPPDPRAELPSSGPGPAVVAAASPTDPIVTGPFLDVPALLGKSQKQVKAVLGEPTSCDTVKPSGVGSVPKCLYRGGNIEVVYIGGKADWLTIYGPGSAPDHAQPYLDAPFDPASLSLLNLAGDPTSAGPVGNFWEGSIDGVRELSMFKPDLESNRIHYVYIKARTK